MLSEAVPTVADLRRARRIVDCHLHVIGDGIAHPYVAAPAYAPTAAPLDTLLAMHERSGIGRAVLVQVSVHGTDNSLMIEALRRGGRRFRGVAVVEAAPSDAMVRALADAGVVGLRLNLVQGGGPGLAALDRQAALCRDLGWHLQLFGDGRALPDLAARLGRLPCPVVLDHFGGVPAALGRSHAGFEALLGLVRDGAWVKLSGPYRVSSQIRGFDDTVASGRDLIAAAPRRCVWGTDWPHVAAGAAQVDIERLLALVQPMAGAAAEALLVTNAERLYGFDAIAG